MDLSNLPKPVWYVLTAVLLLTVGYGAATHVPGLNGEQKSTEKQKSTDATSLSSIKVSVFEEATQNPVPGAKVIMESEGGSDTDTTDNLGAFRIQIPKSEYVRIRITKEGCEPYNQNINLESNPGRPKQILLKCSKNSGKPLAK